MTDLRERFEHDLADLRLPPGFESTVVEQGRRLRTRRRLVRTAGGLTTLGVAAAAAVVVLGGSQGEARDPGFADDPPPSVSIEETSPRPSGWWDMPARRMLAELKAALPAGVSVTEATLLAEGVDGPIKAIGSLSGVLSADTGPGTFQVLLYPPDPTEPLPDPVTTTDADGNEHTTVTVAGPSVAQRIKCRAYMTTCQPLLDDSGRVVGRISTDTDQGTTYYDVSLAGPDGGALYLYVADSSGEKPGYEAPSASEPPLTPEELVALARNAAWTEYEPTR